MQSYFINRKLNYYTYKHLLIHTSLNRFPLASLSINRHDQLKAHTFTKKLLNKPICTF